MVLISPNKWQKILKRNKTRHNNKGTDQSALIRLSL
jgi:hypothetical protein